MCVCVCVCVVMHKVLHSKGMALLQYDHLSTSASSSAILAAWSSILAVWSSILAVWSSILAAWSSIRAAWSSLSSLCVYTGVWSIEGGQHHVILCYLLTLLSDRDWWSTLTPASVSSSFCLRGRVITNQLGRSSVQVHSLKGSHNMLTSSHWKLREWLLVETGWQLAPPPEQGFSCINGRIYLINTGVLIFW